MRLLFLSLLAFPAAVGAAHACPPPDPGQPESERLKPNFDAASDIVYGVVLEGARGGRKARFEIIHTYKGNLKPGMVIRAVPALEFDPPSCLITMGVPIRPSVTKGRYGVVAFTGAIPALRFVDEHALELAFAQEWIRRARP